MEWRAVYEEIRARVSDTYLAITGDVARERAELKGHISGLEKKVAEQEKDLMTDPLTGAYSNRFLPQCISAEIARQKRNVGYNWSTLVCDLKRFKRINDDISYAAGNDALIQYVTQLKKKLREQDKIIRRGGDEFFIILPDTAYDQATQHIVQKLTMEAQVHDSLGNTQSVLLESHVQVCRGCSDKTVEEFICLLDSLVTTAKRTSAH